jgi:acid phosphatase (class A)
MGRAVNASRRRLIAVSLGVAAVCGTAAPLLLPRSFHYLPGDTTAFVALFQAPPAQTSVQTRRELDVLLELQRARSETQVAAARADRKKDVTRFYAALGLEAARAPRLPRVHDLTDAAEDDIGPYVKAVKRKYRRRRPYEIEPRLEPCIDDVAGDLSFPSGHATYGYVMAYLLADLVPERRAALEARADEFARQRAVCGVHFPSDLEAGRLGARWLVAELAKNAAYREDAEAARRELRAALKLP